MSDQVDIKDLYKLMNDFREEINHKLQAMEDREINRVKDLYDHIDRQIEKSINSLKSDLEKKADKDLFDQHVVTNNQRFDFIWKVLFAVGGLLAVPTIGLVFNAFLNK